MGSHRKRSEKWWLTPGMKRKVHKLDFKVGNFYFSLKLEGLIKKII